MKQLGYGVLRDGQPTGLWPKPWKRAMQYAKKENIGSQKGRIEVVPIFIGGAIPFDKKETEIEVG